MNLNYAIQNSGRLAWDGALTYPIDIRRHNGFAFTFEVLTLLAADTVFNAEAAPPLAADPCQPGTFVPVPEVLTCTADFGVQPGAQATLMLPAGTPAGALCTATLPCRPDAFVRLVGASGDFGAIRAVMILHGPR